MISRYAILIDGGFFTKKFRPLNKCFPSADQVDAVVCELVRKCPDVAGRELLRIFYYDARPVSKTIKNPVSGTEIKLGCSELAQNSNRLHQELALKPNFAVRLGETKVFGWTAKLDAKKHSLSSGKVVETSLDDWAPNIKQKGVDLRIGLDIACMALRRTVDTIILFSGDTDIVPSLKLARKEGLRVIVVIPSNGGVASSLTEHSDQQIKLNLKLQKN